MDIRLKNRFILYLGVVSTILVVAFTISFGVYEYRREHAFRVDILHSQLQLNNYHYLEGKADTGIRLTVLDTLGTVLFDSEVSDIATLGNHLHREEIQAALCNGSGYDIKRASTATHEMYFYSATRFDSLLVRSAIPYNTPLTASLERDYTFFYYTVGIIVLIVLILFLRLRLHRSEEDKRRIKRQLTENAAHELKTPAAAIEGYLETLISSEEQISSQQRLAFLSRCYAQSQRMSRLLQDMSMLTRLDEAAIVRPHTPVDAAEIIQGIVDETSAKFSERGMVTDLTSLPARMPMNGDAALIYSLFRNIFDNTLAYANGATRFTVSAMTSMSDYIFIFSDNGIGVPTEHLPHLFERFYRVDKGRSRKLGGTGLGLAIVKNIAVQYGGSASAETTPGGGLTIRITLQVS